MGSQPHASPRRRVGLLGGTFDPIHVGHLVIGEWVRDRLGLEELRLLVAGDPWMKQQESPASHRVAMARAAVAANPAITVDDRETHRDGPTYTAETLAQLHDEEPDVDWTFLLGADAASHLPTGTTSTGRSTSPRSSWWRGPVPTCRPTT